MQDRKDPLSHTLSHNRIASSAKNNCAMTSNSQPSDAEIPSEILESETPAAESAGTVPAEILSEILEPETPATESATPVPNTPAPAIPAPAVQPSTAPKASSSSEKASKPAAFFRLIGQLLGIVAAALPIVLSLLGQLLKLLLKGLQILQAAWAALLPQIRQRLPEPWKTRVPAPILTAIALLFLAFCLWLPLSLFAEKPPAIAQVPNPPIAVRSVEPPPNPDKLAKIQTQLAETSEVLGLVQSIQVNSRRSRLTVNVSDVWYGLEPQQQDKIASEWLKRSRRLKFDQLALTDSEGILLARSPVVGSTLLILERTRTIAPSITPG